jgi:CRISPR-associated protein Cmr2
MSETHLCLVQIGPVQPFIAAARRIEDLYIGSALLSAVARAGAQAASDAGGDLIFPIARNGRLPISVPHRFVFLKDRDPLAACHAVKDAMQRFWSQQIVAPVQNFLRQYLGGGSWEERLTEQSAQWPEITWVAVPYDPIHHGKCFDAASRAMAARRQASVIAPVKDTTGEEKCTLTGASPALLPNAAAWEPVRRKVQSYVWESDEPFVIRANENLGALAAIKRLAGRALPDELWAQALRTYHLSAQAIARGKALEPDWQAPKVHDEQRQPLYLGVVHLDGDHMGDLLAVQTTAEGHRAISMALARFAEEIVPPIVHEHKGVLIYAGGDDVLALMPAARAVPCAAALHQRFRESMQPFRGGSSASAGISIAPYNYPLDLALDTARAAEKRAKEEYKRAAVVVREQRGEIRDAGAKWRVPAAEDGSIADLVADLIKGFTPGADSTAQWSSSLGYDIATLVHQLGSAPDLADARKAEVTRLLRRRLTSSIPQAAAQAVVEKMAKRLITFGEAAECGWESLAHWIILARFLGRGETA